MARRKKRDIDFSNEFKATWDRVEALAHQLASALTGDPLSPEGKVATPRSAALMMGMIAFLLRIGPGDLEALFFADGSLKDATFKPGVPAMRDPPLAALLD